MCKSKEKRDPQLSLDTSEGWQKVDLLEGHDGNLMLIVTVFSWHIGLFNHGSQEMPQIDQIIGLSLLSSCSARPSSPILKLLMDSLLYNQGLQLQLDPSHDWCVFSMNSHCFKRVCFELNSSVFCFNVQGLKCVWINVKTNWMSCFSDSRGWSNINSVFNLNLIWFIWHLSHSKVESRGEKWMDGWER